MPRTRGSLSTSVQARVLRRAIAGLRPTEDTARRLAGMQGRGGDEPDGVGDPGSAGARTLVRALRTRTAVQAGAGWVWPHWLERQSDPTSPSFVARGDVPLLTNLTHRNWTAVGALDTPRWAIVDPRGLVTPARDGCSLDWWIGADDRRHVPARELAARQRRVGRSPVVETALSTPSGRAVRTWFSASRSLTGHKRWTTPSSSVASSAVKPVIARSSGACAAASASGYNPKMGERFMRHACVNFRRSALGPESVCSCGKTLPCPNSSSRMRPKNPLRTKCRPSQSNSW